MRDNRWRLRDLSGAAEARAARGHPLRGPRRV